MSSKLVTDRKNRIELMLNWAKIETERKIEYFEQLIAENSTDNTKERFNKVVWVNKPQFMAETACNTGLRPRLIEEYFSLLQTSGQIQENLRTLGDNQKFRNCEAVNEYWQKHKFNEVN
jgi:hypothetical protein